MSRLFAGLILWYPEAANVIPRAQSLPKHLANIFRQNDIRSLACLASGDGCALTLVLALTVAVVLVARDQQEGMRVAIGENTEAGNLSAVIDIQRPIEVLCRVGRDKSVQVDHRSALLPQERVHNGEVACC